MTHPFQIGDKVRFSDHGRQTFPRMPGAGVVVGFLRDPNMMCIKTEGRRKNARMHVTFWEKVPDDELVTKWIAPQIRGALQWDAEQNLMARVSNDVTDSDR